MVWYLFDVYIKIELYMLAWRYEISLFVLKKNISLVICAHS